MRVSNIRALHGMTDSSIMPSYNLDAAAQHLSRPHSSGRYGRFAGFCCLLQVVQWAKGQRYTLQTHSFVVA